MDEDLAKIRANLEALIGPRQQRGPGYRRVIRAIRLKNANVAGICQRPAFAPKLATHRYRWKKYPALYGRRCRVLARGSMNSVLIRFEDGTRCVCSRLAIRRV